MEALPAPTFKEVPVGEPNSPILADALHLLHEYGSYMFDDLGLQDEKDTYYQSLEGFPTGAYRREEGGAYFVAYAAKEDLEVRDRNRNKSREEGEGQGEVIATSSQQQEGEQEQEQVPVGIIGLRRYGDEEKHWCEMKRIFVSPRHRGRGLGASLVRFIVAEAVGMGYVQMWLDSDREMGSALRLYERFGFTFIDNYNGNENVGAVFMRRDLP